jgi:hypothetical protein
MSHMLYDLLYHTLTHEGMLIVNPSVLQYRQLHENTVGMLTYSVGSTRCRGG